MILTISTTHFPATDLGFLLHKHPNRFQSIDLAIGKAHIFYPESSDDRTTAALLLDMDPIDMVKGKRKYNRKGFSTWSKRSLNLLVGFFSIQFRCSASRISFLNRSMCFITPLF
ncbi:hypothetical protein RM545_14785 [Zunongwangia sp. F260]|uniref:Hen1 N-terminal domain-containing protein n=1 Tax=Autumnicola lenta TaxID=3075593 RepID=A0ABU3CNN1_9FLAO|nr:hypothetical protein [Zunongwangia sp. F260]MDT0647962.1 hypothetical protein [Zunongwangia sp. F260]